jgi:hypothetical protein
MEASEMKPVFFPEKNRTLQRPPNTTDEQCIPLDVHTDGMRCLSCWKGSLLDRVVFLFTGKVWLWVWSGDSQHPAALDTNHPFRPVPRGSWLLLLALLLVILVMPYFAIPGPQ